MDQHELRQLGEELATALDQEGKPFFELKVRIGRLISHLESEQRVTVRMEKQMDQMEERMKEHDFVLFGDRTNPDKNPGLVAVYAEIRRGLRRKEKIMWVVLASVLAPLVVTYAPKIVKLIHP